MIDKDYNEFLKDGDYEGYINKKISMNLGAKIADDVYFSDPRHRQLAHYKWLKAVEEITEEEAVICQRIAIQHLDNLDEGMEIINGYLNRNQ